jgi:hypothetical protein
MVDVRFKLPLFGEYIFEIYHKNQGSLNILWVSKKMIVVGIILLEILVHLYFCNSYAMMHFIRL